MTTNSSSEKASEASSDTAQLSAEAQQAGYTVELGDQIFTQAQWEALQPYIEGRVNAGSEDAARWSPPAALAGRPSAAADTPPLPADMQDQADRLGDLLAVHAFSHVNQEGWTACLCGYVAQNDDDDGSHARHQGAVVALVLAARPSADTRALRDALRVHHPIMRSETGPFSGCCCGAVKLGEDVIAHVVGELRAALDGPR